MTVTDTRPTERSPYLEGSYRPIQTEISAELRPVDGAVPVDLAGIFCRNGSNPRFDPPGRYHWFDGDGMVHAVELADGKATYRNRFVRTAGLAADDAAGEALRTGILERPTVDEAGGVYKDTGNTDLVWFNRELLALWWLSGSAHRLSVPDLDTLGVQSFGGSLATNIAAHAKVDPSTGELLFIDYQPFPPYLRFGVIGADGRLAHQVDLDLPGPRLQHDLAFTPRYAVVFDFSMMWDPEQLAQGKVRMAFRKELPTRIGLLPRRGQASEVQWFEAEPCFMYHVINAWEDGDEVVLVGCQIPDPILTDDNASEVVPHLAHLRLAPNLHEWRMNPTTGALTERTLDPTFAEFPRMHDGRLGAPSRIAYSPRCAPLDVLQFDGIIKHNVTTGEQLDTYQYPAGVFGGEVSFAPRGGAANAAHGAGGVAAEDDGYLLTFAADDHTGDSWLYVFDAAAVGEGPVCRLEVPQRVPTGYHTRWIPGDEL